MKMKKILSLVIATTMAAAVALPLGSIASAATDPVINVNAYTAEEAGLSVKAISGYTPYIVEYSLSGTGMDEEDIAIANLTIKYTVSDVSKVNVASFAKAVVSGKSKAMNGEYTNADYSAISNMGHPFTMDYSGSTAIINWTAATPIDPYTWEDGDEPPAATTPIMKNIIYVADGESVTLTYVTGDKEDSLLTMCDYNDVDTNQSEYYGETLAFSQPTVTLGEAAEEPETPTFTYQDAEGDYAENADPVGVLGIAATGTDEEGNDVPGFVWAGVKLVGFSTYDATGTYKAIFTDDTEATHIEDIDIAGEIDGDANVSIVLKTARTGVKMRLAWEADAE